MFNELHTKFTTKQIRIAAFISGSIVVSLWTLFRLYSRQITFDLVGQQVLAHQWLHHFSSGAMIGQTNYLLKLLLIYMPVDTLPFSPFATLAIYTIIVNIVTFALTVYFLERIWQLFTPVIPKAFYIVAFWFATIAGSVYWIQFTNSRNLEVAVGVLLAYALLAYYKQKRSSLLLLLAGVSAVLFFADILQFYMVAVPIIGYICLVELRQKKRSFRTIGVIIATIGLAYIIARGALEVIASLLSLNIVGASHTTSSGISVRIPFEAIHQFLRLYMGGYEFGGILIAINTGIVVAVITLGIYKLLTRKKTQMWHIAVLCYSVIAVDLIVYIASGQTPVEGSFRYLIMTAPFFVLLAADVLNNSKKNIQRILVAMIAGTALATALCLVVQTVQYSINRDLPNAQSYATIDFARTYSVSFASMDTALSADFLSHEKVTILPLECFNNTLRPVNLFFDKAYYQKHLSTAQTLTPIILDGQEITNKPYTCTLDSIERQFGSAQELTQLSNGSFALLYPTAQLLSTLQEQRY